MINLYTIYTINYEYVNFEFISIVLEKFINSRSYIDILIVELKRCILSRCHSLVFYILFCDFLSALSNVKYSKIKIRTKTFF